MKEEIKDLLEFLQKVEFHGAGASIENEDLKLLLDYIIDLQERIDKALDFIEKELLKNKIEKVDRDYDEVYYSDLPVERIKPLVNILKGKI